MKCVCPMGGNRTCPEDCPLAVWASLSEPDRKAQRKPVAEKLYRQGFTMETIATQLGVSPMTISKDISTFKQSLNVNDRGQDTLGRKRSTGRPKGRKAKPRQTDADEKKIVALYDEGLPSPKIAAEIGVDGRAVRHVIEREQIRREAKAEPDIDPATLSMSAQEKLIAAIRQHQRKLDLQFEQRVRDGIKSRIDEIVLPHWKEQIAKAQELYKHRRGAMDKDTFNVIRRALHPDSRLSISDKKLGEAFDTFMSLEKYLLDEKDSPTHFDAVPSNLAEWDRMRAAARAERKLKRNTSSSAIRPR